LWITRLQWIEFHVMILDRWKFDEQAAMMPGALVSDSRGIYDAATTSDSPQK
jgi:hypothetical protein